MRATDVFRAVAPKPPPPDDWSYEDELPEGWTGGPTLGPYLIRFMRENLRNDDGEPWVPVPWQRDIICRLYRVDRRTGRFVYRRGSLRSAKGRAKSPLGAALCIVELCGPCRLAGWNEDGTPRAKPAAAPWVLIAGVSAEGTRPVWQSILSMTVGSPLLSKGLDVGLTRCRFGPGLLTIVTASPSAVEGSRPTFTWLEETGLWTEARGGHLMFEALSRSAGKVRDARMVDVSNRHQPGLSTVGERLEDAVEELREHGESLDEAGILWDCPEGDVPDLSDLDRLRAELERLYAGCPWVDVQALVDRALDPSTDPQEFRRFHLNQAVVGSAQFASPALVDACLSSNVEIQPGDMCVLGCDPGGIGGSGALDSTGLVLTRVEDGATLVLGHFAAPLDEAALNEAVRQAFARYRIVAFASDVHPAEHLIEQWRALYGSRLMVRMDPLSPVSLDFRANRREIELATEALRREIEAGKFALIDNGEPAQRARQHLLNAVVRETRSRIGIGFAKPGKRSPLKVDLLAAIVAARVARDRVRRDLRR